MSVGHLRVTCMQVCRWEARFEYVLVLLILLCIFSKSGPRGTVPFFLLFSLPVSFLSSLFHWSCVEFLREFSYSPPASSPAPENQIKASKKPHWITRSYARASVRGCFVPCMTFFECECFPSLHSCESFLHLNGSFVLHCSLFPLSLSL